MAASFPQQFASGQARETRPAPGSKHTIKRAHPIRVVAVCSRATSPSESPSLRGPDAPLGAFLGLRAPGLPGRQTTDGQQQWRETIGSAAHSARPCAEVTPKRTTQQRAAEMAASRAAEASNAASAVGSGPVLPRRSRAPRRKLEPPACRRRWRDAIESGPGLSGAVAANRRNALLTSALRVYLGPGPGRIWRSSARGERDTIRWHHIREAQQSAGVITIEGIASLSAATLNLLSPTMRPAGTIYEAVLVCRAVSWPPYLLNRRLT
jgi:hypothetical protein